jgi:very-short-patch-repair endonuclease
MEELVKTMYFNAKPDAMQAARTLSKNMTLCEKLLCEELKGKKICGIPFR